MSVDFIKVVNSGKVMKQIYDLQYKNIRLLQRRDIYADIYRASGYLHFLHIKLLVCTKIDLEIFYRCVLYLCNLLIELQTLQVENVNIFSSRTNSNALTNQSILSPMYICVRALKEKNGFNKEIKRGNSFMERFQRKTKTFKEASCFSLLKWQKQAARGLSLTWHATRPQPSTGLQRATLLTFALQHSGI